MINYNCGIKSKGTITIIQGDTFQRTFVIRMTGGDKLLFKEPGDGGVIQELWFSCAKLPEPYNHIQIDPKVDPKDPTKIMKGYFKLTIPSDATAKFLKCSTTYDITLNFGKKGNRDEEPDIIKTIRYEYPLEVLPKINEIK